MPKIKYPDQVITESAKTFNKLVGGAISEEILKLADHKAKKEGIQVYNQLLLDSISARQNHDFRGCILLSAMALETLLDIELDKHYQELIKRNNSDRYRFRDITIRKNNKKKLDPIYKFLKKKSSFKNKLHELPLYIFGSSLQYADKNLYDKAIQIYHTRSKIVHSGVLPNSGNYLEVNRNGAMEAIETVIGILEWFGFKNKFSHLIENESIPCSLIKYSEDISK